MIVYIGLALFMSITMVVLLAATIMLIIRAVVLVFVMVLAPLGFAAMAIPPLAGLGKQWRDMLISQAFFAPVYLLLLLVSLKIMTALQAAFTPSGTSSATILQALSTPNTASSTIFIFFALIIGFMIAAMMTAKRMGAIGADFATNIAQKTVKGTVLAPARAGLAGSAFVARRTAGRGSAALAARIRSGGFERFGISGESSLGRFAAGVADKGASASYDLRATKLLKNAGLGGPSKDASHGYHGIEEKAIKERLEYAKTLTGRDMTDAERERLITDTAAITAARLAEQNTANLENQAALAEKQKQETILAQIKALAAQNPTDAAIAKRVVDQTQKVTESQNELNSSTSKLVAANKALTEAQKADTAAREKTKLSATEQRNVYATNIERERVIPFIGQNYTDENHEHGHGLTTALHANNKAAGKIRNNETKSKLEKALEALNEEKEKGSDKGDGHGDEHH